MFERIANLFRKQSEVSGEVEKGTVYFQEKDIFTDPFKKNKEEAMVTFKKGTKQVTETVSKWLGIKELVSRPYDPNIFLELYESSEPFAATVDQIAADTAGLGWKLILKEDATENKKEKEKIEYFISHCNPLMSFRDILNSILRDWGIMGRGALEVVRNDGGEVAEIYHLRISTLWIHRERKKYNQKIGMDEVWFKVFGVKEDFNKDTGKEETELSEDKKANEIITFETKFGKNSYYPIPNILPAVLSVVCLREIRSFNLSFFANYSIPAMLITLIGNWDKGAEKKIVQFLDEKIKGSENANKTMVLKVPKEGSIQLDPLTTLKEAAYKNYEPQLEDSILMVYSMPPYRIGKNVQGRLGGTNTKEANEIYKNSVIEPLQEKIENFMNLQIIEDGLDCHAYKFELTNMDTRDLNDETERATKLIEHGVKTPNQVRAEIYGQEGYVGGDKYYMGQSFTEIGEAEVKKQDEDDMKLISEIVKLKEEIQKSKEEGENEKDTLS